MNVVKKMDEWAWGTNVWEMEREFGTVHLAPRPSLENIYLCTTFIFSLINIFYFAWLFRESLQIFFVAFDYIASPYRF